MGSPRLQSNTDIIAGKIIEGIRAAGTDADQIEKVDLVEYEQFVCVACGYCREAGTCMHFPKVSELIEKIKGADGLVIATPTWWIGPSSQLKIFMDHWGTFLRQDYSSRIEGKRAVLASCCGNPEVNYAERVNSQLEEILSLLGVRIMGSLAAKGVAGVGAVSREPDILEAAVELGKKLYS